MFSRECYLPYLLKPLLLKKINSCRYLYTFPFIAYGWFLSKSNHKVSWMKITLSLNLRPPNHTKADLQRPVIYNLLVIWFSVVLVSLENSRYLRTEVLFSRILSEIWSGLKLKMWNIMHPISSPLPTIHIHTQIIIKEFCFVFFPQLHVYLSRQVSVYYVLTTYSGFWWQFLLFCFYLKY